MAGGSIRFSKYCRDLNESQYHGAMVSYTWKAPQFCGCLLTYPYILSLQAAFCLDVDPMSWRSLSSTGGILQGSWEVQDAGSSSQKPRAQADRGDQ